MTTPKKAPTASEARSVAVMLRELICAIPEKPHKNRDMWTAGYEFCREAYVAILQYRLTAAERAEAEAAQEPGDSVEGLMESNPGMPGSEGRYALLYWPTSALDHERYLAAPVNDVSGVLDALHSAIGSGRTALAALRDARSKHAPAAPDATWLDTATFEEMEACLPDDIEILSGIRSSVPGFWVRRTFEAQFSGVFAPTRTEAVRAFLKANPELWSNRT